MNGMVMGALVALSMVQQTDTVFPAGGARTLELDLGGGSVVVTAWDRDEVRIQASHSTRTEVQVRRTRDGARIDVEAEARRAAGAALVDYVVSIPRAMGVEVDAMAADVTIEGVGGGVEIDVTRGDLILRGGRGTASLNSTTGKILVEGWAGDVEAETAAGEIRLVEVTGAVGAESAGGDIILVRANTASVDVGTVGGRIHFEGRYQPGGTYLFGTHGGTLTLVVPEGTAATFRLATAYGSVLDATGATPQRYTGGQRHTVEKGGGGALVEAETFGGRIVLVRPGGEGSSPPPGDHH